MLLGGYSDFLEHCQVGITSGFHSLTSNVKTCVPNMPISYISGCAGLLQHHVGHAHRCDAECRGRESWDQDEPDRRGAASSESYQAPSHMDKQVGWLEKKTLNQRKRGIYGKVHCSFPKPFQCSQPGLPLPDPKSDLCWAVPPRFCNQPPPIGPGQEWGGIAATEDGDGGPGTTFAPSGIRFLIYFLPTPFF